MNWINKNGVKVTEPEQVRNVYGTGWRAAVGISARFAGSIQEGDLRNAEYCLRDAYVASGDALSRAGYGARDFKEGFLEIAEPITIHPGRPFLENVGKLATGVGLFSGMLW